MAANGRASEEKTHALALAAVGLVPLTPLLGKRVIRIVAPAGLARVPRRTGARPGSVGYVVTL